MSTVSQDHVVQTLRQAREELEKDFQIRTAALDQAIAAITGEEVSIPAPDSNGDGNGKDDGELSIGSDKLNKVRNVLRTSANGKLRQADITKKTKLNSGTVSVALRRLEQINEVRSTGEKADGSMVWEEIRPTRVAAAKTR